MAAVKAAKNHGDELSLTRYLRWGIYTSIWTWTQSQNLLAAKEALTSEIYFHGASLKWSQKLSQPEKEHSYRISSIKGLRSLLNFETFKCGVF